MATCGEERESEVVVVIKTGEGGGTEEDETVVGARDRAGKRVVGGREEDEAAMAGRGDGSDLAERASSRMRRGRRGSWRHSKEEKRS